MKKYIISIIAICIVSINTYAAFSRLVHNGQRIKITKSNSSYHCSTGGQCIIDKSAQNVKLNCATGAKCVSHNTTSTIYWDMTTSKPKGLGKFVHCDTVGSDTICKKSKKDRSGMFDICLEYTTGSPGCEYE